MKLKTDWAQSSSKCKNHLLKVYLQLGNAPVKVNSVQKATNAPPCTTENSRKYPTPGATEDVPDEFVVK